jgi:hypothetical protein
MPRVDTESKCWWVTISVVEPSAFGRFMSQGQIGVSSPQVGTKEADARIKKY